MNRWQRRDKPLCQLALPFGLPRSGSCRFSRPPLDMNNARSLGHIAGNAEIDFPTSVGLDL